MKNVGKRIFIFVAIITTVTTPHAATLRGVSTSNRNVENNAIIQSANPNNSYTYNYMYPYLNNQMRTTLKPSDTTSPTTSPINAVVRTEQLSAPRRVVARTAKQTTTNTISAPSRRVVARASVTNPNRNVATRTVVTRTKPTIENGDSSRFKNTYMYRASENAANNIADTPTISSARCLADYTDCMNMYCLREDTKYNRCYCSSKLSQIDATYQPAIDTLVKQIKK